MTGVNEKMLDSLLMKQVIYPFLILLVISASSCKNSLKKDHTGWNNYAGSKEGNRYSSNDEINLNNIKDLEIAWTYSSGDKDTANRSQNQCNPIVMEGILYGTTPRLKLFALDASTGKQKWSFDPATVDTSSKDDPMAFYKVTRGVTYWQDKEGKDKRIFYGVGARTYSIDAGSGKPVVSFGKGGYIDLSENLDREPGFNPFVANTTPGIIYKDLLILGMRLAESADAAPGHIRAFDVRTGKRKWIFHTVPHPGEKGYDSWEDPEAWKKFGGANNWAGMSLDEERGIVYVPTGSVGGDFYGGTRKGSNLFSNSLIALNAETGKYIWHYQVVHHDLWDRDLAANPNLVTLNQNGRKIDAVAQITKHGYIFMFDRITGEPVFKIKEKLVPTDALPGEKVWPTQPIPTLPQPFARQRFEPEDVTDISPETHKEMMAKYLKVKDRAKFSPPSKEGGWIFPGFDGGGEWGGAAVDMESQILYVNSTELPWAQVMIDVPKKDNQDLSQSGIGQGIYNQYCISCHGTNLKGNGGNIPGLVDLEKKYTELQTRNVIRNGRNMMPAFKQISEGDIQALVGFLLKIPEKEPAAKLAGTTLPPKEPGTKTHLLSKKSVLDDIPYTMAGYDRFIDKDGYPGIKPPWGTLNAVNLNTGKLLWKVPLGEYEELTKRGIPVTGTENYGGPLVTKGGLVFIAATKDEKIRAFDKNTGKVVWEAKLPAAGYATPATYSLNGRQYVVIACGGGKIGSKSGDTYVAFALPGSK
ncbi:MAG: PQQ-binding-like beta-propeller repeat protein [Flavobacterium sp.]|nr:PQQ-binding-like beta-propeller repeat protein [Pedobacter sp.]